MATKIKRSEIQTFLNTTPLAAATYALLGDGVVSGKISYNPKTSEETYINEDSATITLESYAPTLPVEMTAKFGDTVFDFVDNLRVTRAVLADAETDIVNVWAYEAGGPTAYPAEKQNVSIQINDFGGDGGQAAKINYTINFVGDPVVGTFNVNTKVFTPS
jgi:hypothetical protein